MLENPVTQNRKSQLLDQYRHVAKRVRQAEQLYSREPGSVLLLPVSKTFPPSDLAILAEAGVRAFGESYLQEAELKIAALTEWSIDWHFIGPIQSNKTRAIATRFAWVHSVEREKIACRLNDQRPDTLPPLNICLQLNISGEPSKAGLTQDQLPALLEVIETLPRLRLRGLMAIPAHSNDFDSQYQAFAKLRRIFEALCEQGYALDTLSMGMSADLEAAIAQGATIVRVGHDIFGERVHG